MYLLKLIFRVSGFVTPAMALFALGCFVAQLVEFGIAPAMDKPATVFYWALLLFMLHSMRMDAISYQTRLGDEARALSDDAEDDEGRAVSIVINVSGGGGSVSEDTRDAD